MAYPPAPGTTGSSLPPKPPVPAGGANNNNPNTIGLGGGFAKKSGFKPAFSPDATPSYHPKQPHVSTYSGAPGIHQAPSTYAPPTYAGPAAPSPVAQYGAPYPPPQSTHGAVNPVAYQHPPQQQPSYQSQNWNQKQSNWHPPQQQASYSQPALPNPAPQSYAPPQTYGPQSYGQPAAYGGAPQIQNPFNRQASSQGAPVGYGGDYANGPDEAAQIAQWQSAYVSKGPSAWDKDGVPIEQEDSAEQNAYMQAANNNLAENPDKKKTVFRKGGGKSWQDDSLLDWDPAHFRLFVGNLAGETTDDSLLKAFSRWPSVQKARVIRDKRTSKSKGYGFVSLSDADQFFQAAREMHGKYIQSHPVTVKRANTEIKSANIKDKNKNYKNNNRGNGNGSGYANQKRDGVSPSLAPKPGSGVVKPGKKTKNGLKLLG